MSQDVCYNLAYYPPSMACEMLIKKRVKREYDSDSTCQPQLTISSRVNHSE